MRTREERIAEFSKSQQREITLDEATKIIAEEGLDKYKRIEINSNNAYYKLVEELRSMGSHY